MNIEGTLILSEEPTDIIQEGNNLYIAISDKKEIAVIDKETRKITKTFFTAVTPGKLAVHKNKIYYVEFNGFSDVHEYDIGTSQEKIIYVKYPSMPAITVNKEKKLLYVGASGISGGNMVYYSLDEEKIVSETNYKEGYGFLYPSRKIILDGDKVFYANRDFNTETADRFCGNYEGDTGIVFVNGDLVYTNNSIYERESHRKVGDSTFNMELMTGNENTLFIYDKFSKTIKSFKNTSGPIDKTNVIFLISGIPTVKVQEDTKSVKIDGETTALDMNSKLTEWVLHEPTNTLYAISKENKALFFINKTTLNIEGAITFTSGPTDIIEDEGKLYIALDDISEIAVVNMAGRKIEDKLYTDYPPYRLVKNKNKIYYVERNQWSYTHEYNITSKSDRILPIETIYNPDIAINKEKNILYLGESESTKCDLFYYGIDRDEVIDKTFNDYDNEFDYQKRITLYDGENLYYAGRSFKQEEASSSGKYTNGTIIFVSENYVFSSGEVYDKKNYSLVKNLPLEANLVETKDDKTFYIYNVEENKIYKRGPAIIFQKEDVNQDGVIDMKDVNLISSNYNKTSKDSDWNKAYDINGDGIIDIYDLVLVCSKIKN